MMSAPLCNSPEPWNEDDLIERLCHALDIAKLAVEQLAANGRTDAKNPAANIRPEKIISETSILLVAASAAARNSAIDARVKDLAGLLVPHARSHRMMLGLCLDPTVALYYALPHVCLTRLGYHDFDFDELIRECLKSQAIAGRERVPHRVMEQEWIATSWLGPKVLRRSVNASTARLSVLNHPLDLLNGTRDDIYAFTHALMYATDFSAQTAELPRPCSAILAEAEVLLARCVDEEDYDLSGEVLLSWPLTGEPWSAAAAFAFRVLAHVEDKASFLPTPSTRISELKELEGEDRTQYLVATAYHTAYVMGLVCPASLHPGCAPPSTIPPMDAKPGAASRMMQLLDRDGQSPHWCEEFQQLAEAEQDALAGFLVNIALRRCVVRRDYAGVRAVLELA